MWKEIIPEKKITKFLYINRKRELNFEMKICS